jgi:hypothetical protein
MAKRAEKRVRMNKGIGGLVILRSVLWRFAVNAKENFFTNG